MSRRRVAAKREILPDCVFGSVEVTKFVNTVMLNGKKALAEKIVYNAMEKAAERVKNQKDALVRQEDEGRGGRGGDDSEGGSAGVGAFGAKDLAAKEKFDLSVLDHALANVGPLVEVRSRRVGGSTYQVPVEVRASRRLALAMRWLVNAAKGRGEKTMMLKLAGELADAATGKGSAVKRREEAHRMAKANQAFAHYRW